MIQFYLDQASGLPTYLQLTRQVRYGLKMGALREGDQLPTVKDLATRLAINQNTVLKAYRELAFDGLVDRRIGVGTFIRVTLADASPTGSERPTRPRAELLAHRRSRVWFGRGDHPGSVQRWIEV